MAERPQAGPKLLAAGAALDLEVAPLALAAIVGEAEEGKLLRLRAPRLRVVAGEPPERQAAGLLFG
jgi:hypothetical protein